MKEQFDHLDGFPQDEVRLAIRTGIAQAQEQMDGKVKTPYKRKITYLLSSVAAVFGLLFISAQYSPAIATSLSKIPLIGSVFGDSDLIGLQNAYQEGLIDEIGETQTINGISVTLNEVLYDQSNITIGLIIESERELGEHYFGSGMDITINGKLPKAVSGSYGEEMISSTTRTAIQMIGITEEMPDQFELGLTLKGEKGEKWHFSTPIKKIKDIKTIPVQHEQTVDGIQLKVTEVSISKTGVSVSFESAEKVDDFDKTRGNYIDLQVVDQDGNKIKNLSGAVIGERMKDTIVYKSKKQFDPIDSKVTELTITPYLEIPSSGGGVDENGQYIEKDYSGLKEVKFEPFTVKIP
ncbi:DUF4179 domain-containing protein [Ureibacillus sp. FSL K6-3587]|uniref:DUF4179 domain-containing protein n=1 Tax=Ureibacillus sp. FSL K6-3587 TaxID=2954681 RepID=UPI003159394A